MQVRLCGREASDGETKQMDTPGTSSRDKAIAWATNTTRSTG